MKGTVLVCVEGVLAQWEHPDDDDLRTAQVDYLGRSLLQVFQGLGSQLVYGSASSRADVEHFARVNQLGGYAGIERLDDTTVRRMRASGDNLTLYVDVDGPRIINALRSGVPTLLFTRPSFARATNRPDVHNTRRTWEAIQREAAGQRQAKALRYDEDAGQYDTG